MEIDWFWGYIILGLNFGCVIIIREILGKGFNILEFLVFDLKNGFDVNIVGCRRIK